MIFQHTMFGWDEPDVVRVADLLRSLKGISNNSFLEVRKEFEKLDVLARQRAWKKFASMSKCWGGQINHTPKSPQDEIDFFVAMYDVFADLINECNEESIRALLISRYI
jgi:hypothetical protein